MKRARLIYNPAAGRDTRSRASLLCRRLEGAGLEVDVRPTSAPGHAQELAREAAAAGREAVFSFGGDGTLRECAAGLMGSDTPLGFLPGGTANVMARVLGIPGDPLRAADVLARGISTPIDVALCNERPLLMQASAGLDAEVLARLDPARKRRLGKLEVAIRFLPAWWSFAYPPFSLRWAGQERTVTFAAICNVPFYGGPWKIAPAARFDNGSLELVMFSGRGRRASLGFARDLLLNRHHRRADVEIAQVEEAEIGAAKGLALQIDGDSLVDALPARIRLAKQRVNLLIPAPARS